MLSEFILITGTPGPTIRDLSGDRLESPRNFISKLSRLHQFTIMTTLDGRYSVSSTWWQLREVQCKDEDKWII